MNQSHERRWGGILCLISGTGFGTLAILGKSAHDLGFHLSSSLAWRFLGASLFLWMWLFLSGQWKLTRKEAITCLLLGAIGYSGQSGLFFGSLHRVGVALTSLLLYLYPSLVTLLLWGFKGQKPNRTRIVALLLSTAGCVLTVHAQNVALDPIGVAMGLGAALWYACYLTFGAVLVKEIRPMVVSGYVCIGAGIVFFAVALAENHFDFPSNVQGWAVVSSLALVATVLPVVLLFEGIKRIGAAKASILSSFELVVALGLGIGVAGERLATGQLVGAALILIAVVIVQRQSEE